MQKYIWLVDIIYNSYNNNNFRINTFKLYETVDPSVAHYISYSCLYLEKYSIFIEL